jgi:hypothetical protein
MTSTPLLRLTAAVVFASVLAAAEPVRLQTDHLLLLLDQRGWLAGLTGRRSGISYLATDQAAPLLQVRTAAGFTSPEAMEWDATSGRMTLRYGSVGVTARLRAEAKATHMTFELLNLDPADKATLVLWGPYPTTIGAVVGETIGVVRNAQFALGIQALNRKTLGGFPHTEDDVMPMSRAPDHTACAFVGTFLASSENRGWLPHGWSADELARVPRGPRAAQTTPASRAERDCAC